MTFGSKIQEIINNLEGVAIVGSPVNAVNASMTLTIAGVSVDGETVSINNPAIVGSDVYEFLADTEQMLTVLTHIPVDITSYAAKAVGTLTIDTQPNSGDTMTIGEKTFTFVPEGTDTADGEVSIGIDLATAQAAIVDAINGTDGVNTPHVLVSASEFVINECVITALIGGVSGNLIDTTEEFTIITNTFAAITLGTGSDCSAANAVTALTAAITSEGTQGVSAVDSEGDTIVLTADVAGVIGNAIVIGETMTNGSFTDDAVLLAGGIDGTVGSMTQSMIDDAYLYKSVADNTTAGKNWRRISIGSVY